LIQEAGLLDSIVAYSTHATDFCNTIPPIADIRQRIEHVCYVPIADIHSTLMLKVDLVAEEAYGGR
jgi:hypothetical protein